MGRIIYYIKYWIHYIGIFSLCIVAFVPAVIFFRRAFVQEYLGGAYAHFVTFLLRLKITVKGRENVPAEPVVYVMNHQSSLDAVTFLYVKLPNTKVIAKKELFYVPIFGWTVYATGNIPLDRSSGKRSASAIDYGVRAIHRRKVSIAVFPEGTRNIEGEFNPFKQGAFRIAVTAGVPIVPVVFSSYSSFLDKKRKRWRSGEIKVDILPPVQTKGLDKQGTRELVEDVYKKMLAAFTADAEKP